MQELNFFSSFVPWFALKLYLPSPLLVWWMVVHNKPGSQNNSQRCSSCRWWALHFMTSGALARELKTLTAFSSQRIYLIRNWNIYFHGSLKVVFLSISSKSHKKNLNRRRNPGRNYLMRRTVCQCKSALQSCSSFHCLLQWQVYTLSLSLCILVFGCAQFWLFVLQ